MKKIKKWDTVQVISGKYKWKIGLVEKMQESLLVVTGVNIMKRATKWKGFVDKIHPIDSSNVAYYDTETNKISKIRIIIDADWNKKRQITKTNRIIAK